jgi:hypothetical protein
MLANVDCRKQIFHAYHVMKVISDCDGHVRRCTVKAGGPDDANRSFTSSRTWSVAISPQEQFYVCGRVREASRIVASQPLPLRVHVWQAPLPFPSALAPAQQPAPALAPAPAHAPAPAPAPEPAEQLATYASQDVRVHVEQLIAPNNRDQVIYLSETLTNLCCEYALIQGFVA